MYKRRQVSSLKCTALSSTSSLFSKLTLVSLMLKGDELHVYQCSTLPLLYHVPANCGSPPLGARLSRQCVPIFVHAPCDAVASHAAQCLSVATKALVRLLLYASEVVLSCESCHHAYYQRRSHRSPNILTNISSVQGI